MVYTVIVITPSIIYYTWNDLPVFKRMIIVKENYLGLLVLDNELEPTYSNFVPLQNVSLKTYRKQWRIEKGGEKGSGISVLLARHDDDDDDDDDES